MVQQALYKEMNNSHVGAMKLDVASMLIQANERYNRSCQSNLPEEMREIERAKAQSICEHLYHRDHELPQVVNLMGRIAIDQHNYASAEDHFHNAIMMDDSKPSFFTNLGYLYLMQRRFTEALKSFKNALELDKQHVQSLSGVALTYLNMGNYTEAFQVYRNLIRTGHFNENIQSGIFRAASLLKADSYQVEIENDLIRYMQYPNADYDLLSNLATSTLDHKFNISGDTDTPLDIYAIAKDTLFLETLSKVHCTDVDLENTVRAMRFLILSESMEAGHIIDDFIPLAIAIGIQSSRNGYVMSLYDDESEVVESLISLIEQITAHKDWDAQDITGAIILLAMYSPFSGLTVGKAIKNIPLKNWPEMIQPLIEKALSEPEEIAKRALTFKQDEPESIKDSMIKQQYERFPYPHWSNLGYHTSCNYTQALRHELPHVEIPERMKGRTLNILIAGCGTGLQALKAARFFHSVNVTAIDVSAESLAFAEQQAEKLNIKNVNFKALDLRNVQELNQSFDIIECSGVLHHLPDPNEGLSALLSCLKNDGFIKLGLYSATARTKINQLKEEIIGNFSGANEDQIRKLRWLIMTDENLREEYRKLLSSPDFFHISGCADLLFNPLEHLYDTHSLEALINENSLDFIGFTGLQAERKEQYTKQFPLDSKLNDLSNWKAFEEHTPELFSGMYQFFCRKKR